MNDKKKDSRSLLWNMANGQAFSTSLIQNPRLHYIDKAEKEEIFSSILPPLENLRILELGGGIGRFTTYFAPRAKEVTVIDLAEQSIRENQKRHQNFSNITYMVDSVTDVQFAPQSFDLIFASWLLMYLNPEEINQLLHNCKNWLAPGGAVFFRESCSVNSDRGLIRHLFGLEGLRVIFPFLGSPVYSIWKFKLPSLKDFWHAVRHFEKTVHYRKKDFYEEYFKENFQILSAGNLASYEQLLDNKSQLYWFLSSKNMSGANNVLLRRPK